MGVALDALSKAIRALPGRVPRSFTAQVRILGGRGQHPEQRLARIFGVTPRTAKGWLKGTKTTKGNRAAAQRATDAVEARRKTARARAAAAAGGLRVETRATFGYTASPGTTDEGRFRRLAIDMPPQYAGQLFDAHAAQDEQAAQAALAQGFGEDYFREGNRRAAGLEVELKDIDYMHMDISE